MRTQILIGVTLCALALSTFVHETRSASASPVRRPVAAASDACGFRNAAWEAVQFTADKASAVNPSQLKMNSGDATFLHQAVLDWIADIARDYGSPAGWKAVQASAGEVMAAIHDALYEYEDQGIFDSSIMATARQEQATAWTNLRYMCPGGGKSKTDTGVLTMYDWMNDSSTQFTVAAGWTINYNFDCRGNADYDGHNGTGHVVITAAPVSGGSPITLADQSGSQGSGSQSVHAGGKFRLSVTSECYWHLQVHGHASATQTNNCADTATSKWEVICVSVLPSNTPNGKLKSTPSLRSVKVNQRVMLFIYVWTDGTAVPASTNPSIGWRITSGNRTIFLKRQGTRNDQPEHSVSFTPTHPGSYTFSGTLFVGSQHKHKSVSFSVGATAGNTPPPSTPTSVPVKLGVKFVSVFPKVGSDCTGGFPKRNPVVTYDTTICVVVDYTHWVGNHSTVVEINDVNPDGSYGKFDPSYYPSRKYSGTFAYGSDHDYLLAWSFGDSWDKGTYKVLVSVDGQPVPVQQDGSTIFRSSG